jgi:hypothetical protein
MYHHLWHISPLERAWLSTEKKGMRGLKDVWLELGLIIACVGPLMSRE